jgi:hypothetical protein
MNLLLSQGRQWVSNGVLLSSEDGTSISDPRARLYIRIPRQEDSLYKGIGECSCHYLAATALREGGSPFISEASRVPTMPAISSGNLPRPPSS